MAHLLHIDSSARYEGSVTRSMTAWFTENWRQKHPGGTVTTLDLAREAPMHFAEHDMHRSAEPHPDNHNAEFVRLNKMLRDADTVIVGAPMYNYMVPSSLKAWFDRIAIMANFADATTGLGVLSNKRIVVATARGGSYAKGTPKESFDLQMPYLRLMFQALGMGQDLTFVHTEMTLAAIVPALAQFKDIGEKSYADARVSLQQLAQR